MRVSPLRAEVAILSRDGATATAIATFPLSEPVFAGHYPGFPILPGVCLVECAHLAVVELLGGTPSMTGIDSARFFRPVFPDQTVVLDIELTESDGTWASKSLVRNDNGRVASLRLRHRTGA
jgi:3-hydroxyacyl-[acyl-carrier-protein] dehydratase